MYRGRAAAPPRCFRGRERGGVKSAREAEGCVQNRGGCRRGCRGGRRGGFRSRCTPAAEHHQLPRRAEQRARVPTPRRGAHAAGRALTVRSVELLPLTAEVVPAPQVIEQPGLPAAAVDEHGVQVVVGGGAVVRPRERGRVRRRGRPEHPLRTWQPKLPDELLGAGRSQGQAELLRVRGDRCTYERLQPYVLEAATLCARRSCAPSNSSEAPRPPRSHTLPRSATRE